MWNPGRNMKRGFNLDSVWLRHGKRRNYVWTPQRFARLNFVALALRIAVSLGLSADVSRIHDVDIVRLRFRWFKT